MPAPRSATVEEAFSASAPAPAPEEYPPDGSWRAEPITGVVPADPPRPPLEPGVEVGGVTAALPYGDAAPDDAPLATGHRCVRGHLNAPRARLCQLCGSRMDEHAVGPVSGPRPPLGLLVFDDGAAYSVDAEYLVGRMPEADPRVRSGALRSIVVEDRSGAVSRVHAEIRVNGWDVLLSDAGSRNGTFVAGPGEPGWAPLPPLTPRRLAPGTRVRVGGRMFVFESSSGAR